MKTVFFDVDTQLDFLYPAGALYVPGAEKIVPALARLTRFAVDNQIPIISTADAHAEDDPEFKHWKPHCVVGTVGQQKAGPVTDASQIIIEKQDVNCFTNPTLRPLLARLGADRYVVYGVVAEVCVRHAIFGLLETGARVEVVTDAIKSVDADKEREMLDEFQKLGGYLTIERDQVLASR
jgi:nicotinamidase/pyrazinamidase